MIKLLSLGGNYYQKTMVREAKRMGIYVVDVDYLPNNPAHKIANKYYNISITEKEKILEVAETERINGIISYASDVGALTAAYVAEKMNLPTNPYHTIELMTRKDLFHPFLKSRGFYVPDVSVVKSAEDIGLFLKEHNTVVVKPADSSGSKGISVINNPSDIEKAWKLANQFAVGGNVIVEEFFEKKGYQVSGDIFVVDGIVKNWGFANAHRDAACNAFVPIGDSFPIYMDKNRLNITKSEIQNAITELGFRNGPVNVEFCFDRKDRPIIVELGPRSGGGLLADIIYMTSGVDIISYCVKNAIGMPVNDIEDRPITRNIAAYSFHALKDGIFEALEIKPELMDKILQIEYFINPGEEVYRCDDSGKAIAIAICEFSDQNEMLHMMDSMNDYYKVVYEYEE